MPMNSDETRPLLRSDRSRIDHASQDIISRTFKDPDSSIYRLRKFLQWFLSSKYGHYFVIILVSLDICGIFADFLISLHVCEHPKRDTRTWQDIDDVLDILSLVFSCLFMLELLCSIFAFGLGYFKSKFHIFDALSIIASFLVDVLTHGPVEEAGSLIIVLRLFRVFKIIEESSAAADDELEDLQEKVAELEKENETLRRRQMTSRVSADDV